MSTLENPFKKLNEALPKVKFELMIEVVKCITEETQDLVSRICPVLLTVILLTLLKEDCMHHYECVKKMKS